MPNLDNFKKQAKQYLRWHRERYHPVAAQTATLKSLSLADWGSKNGRRSRQESKP